MFIVHLTFGNFKNFKIYKTQFCSSKCWCTCISAKATLRGWGEGMLAETHTQPLAEPQDIRRTNTLGLCSYHKYSNKFIQVQSL